MTYSVFHILKQYQDTVSCQLDQITLKDLEAFASETRKEEKEYDVFCIGHCSYGSNGNW